MKAAAYARYSTDNQTDNSIAYQMSQIQAYCSSNAIDLCAFYSDEAQTGTNANRQGFQSMLSDARKNKFNAVVIYDITRGSRDVGDWFAFRKEMLMHNISVISATQTLGDMTNPNDFLVELLSVGLGQHQVLDARKKSIAGVAVKAKQGAFLGGIPPLGYDIVNGEYIINPAEAMIVQKIFKMYADGSGYRDIVDSVKCYRGKKGAQIGNNTISGMLQNERYIGTYFWNKRKCKLLNKWVGGTPNPDVVKIENAIPPIIDKEIWNMVQERLHNKAARAKNKAKREYLLSGLIECADCGASYVGQCSVNTRGCETRYYCCGNKKRTRTCKNKNINADQIEVFVVQNLKNYLKTIDFNEMADNIITQLNSASKNCVSEKKELAAIDKKIANGIKAVMEGLDIPELKSEISALKVRKMELEDIISSNKQNAPKISRDELMQAFENDIRTINNCTAQELKAIIKRNVTKIHAHADGSYEVYIGVHTKDSGRGI